MRRIWPVIRRVWITAGISVTVIFVGWSLWAYQATAEGTGALVSDERVIVVRSAHSWYFAPRAPRADVGLLFFPGALVDPAAYAPLARAVAEAGYPVQLVELPRRGALGGADGPEVFGRARDAIESLPHVRGWVAGGHSRGGAVAARLAQKGGAKIAGLVLVGTSHPRDFSLAHITIPVTRVYGTRDTVADVEKLEANRHNLPAAIRDVRIDGGNHSQFGSYGFQPGDWPATIPRDVQQRLTVEAILDTLAGLASRPPSAMAAEA